MLETHATVPAPRDLLSGLGSAFDCSLLMYLEAPLVPLTVTLMVGPACLQAAILSFGRCRHGSSRFPGYLVKESGQEVVPRFITWLLPLDMAGLDL